MHSINRVKTILNIALQITANLSFICEPFLPFSSQKIRDFLNLPEVDWNRIGDADILKAGHQINKPKLLFQQITDEEVQKQIDKLLATKKENEISEYTHEPVKDAMTFEDFQKLDIRTATILEAEKVPKTKKLLKLLVDTGVDKRTVVSGIAEFHKPEDIIGKQVCVLLNLLPRKLKGIESQGMILMAEKPDGTLEFVSPENQTENGSLVK